MQYILTIYLLQVLDNHQAVAEKDYTGEVKTAFQQLIDLRLTLIGYTYPIAHGGPQPRHPGRQLP